MPMQDTIRLINSRRNACCIFTLSVHTISAWLGRSFSGNAAMATLCEKGIESSSYVFHVNSA